MRIGMPIKSASYIKVIGEPGYSQALGKTDVFYPEKFFSGGGGRGPIGGGIDVGYPSGGGPSMFQNLSLYL